MEFRRCSMRSVDYDAIYRALQQCTVNARLEDGRHADTVNQGKTFSAKGRSWPVTAPIALGYTRRHQRRNQILRATIVVDAWRKLRHRR